MMISEEVFNQLYKKYYLDIFKFAFSYVKRKDLAEDVLQDFIYIHFLFPPKFFLTNFFHVLIFFLLNFH